MLTESQSADPNHFRRTAGTTINFYKFICVFNIIPLVVVVGFVFVVVFLVVVVFVVVDVVVVVVVVAVVVAVVSVTGKSFLCSQVRFYSNIKQEFF